VLELPFVGFVCFLGVVFVWTLVLFFLSTLVPLPGVVYLFIYLFGFRAFIPLTYVHIRYAFGPNESVCGSQ
jgi:hypothetical protein